MWGLDRAPWLVSRPVPHRLASDHPPGCNALPWYLPPSPGCSLRTPYPWYLVSPTHEPAALFAGCSGCSGHVHLLRAHHLDAAQGRIHSGSTCCSHCRGSTAGGAGCGGGGSGGVTEQQYRAETEKGKVRQMTSKLARIQTLSYRYYRMMAKRRVVLFSARTFTASQQGCALCLLNQQSQRLGEKQKEVALRWTVVYSHHKS